MATPKRANAQRRRSPAAKEAVPDAPSVAEVSGASPALRVVPTPIPDPEVRGHAARRRFTAEYKLRIVREADGCTSPGEDWFILSAKHGLVEPDKVIGPYNETLNSMSSAERRAWAERVAAKLRPRCRDGAEVVVLAGQAYREHLLPMLQAWGCRVRIPMKGLGIGQQKAWLKGALEGRSSGGTSGGQPPRPRCVQRPLT